MGNKISKIIDKMRNSPSSISFNKDNLWGTGV